MGFNPKITGEIKDILLQDILNKYPEYRSNLSRYSRKFKVFDIYRKDLTYFCYQLVPTKDLPDPPFYSFTIMFRLDEKSMQIAAGVLPWLDGWEWNILGRFHSRVTLRLSDYELLINAEDSEEYEAAWEYLHLLEFWQRLEYLIELNCQKLSERAATDDQFQEYDRLYNSLENVEVSGPILKKYPDEEYEWLAWKAMLAKKS